MTMHRSRIGQTLTPSLAVSCWVQGEPINLSQLFGHVVLLEVFQVNCPGCFLYSLPQAVDLHYRYGDQGLVVIGIATAFEDFDKNTLENLRSLIDSGRVIGETSRMLSEHQQLQDGRWPVRLPFPIAMDHLIPADNRVTPDAVESLIQQKLPGFTNQPVAHQNRTREQTTAYPANLQYYAETFERFALKGTPSQILIDKQGIQRFSQFGFYSELEHDIQDLLNEPAS